MSEPMTTHADARLSDLEIRPNGDYPAQDEDIDRLIRASVVMLKWYDAELWAGPHDSLMAALQAIAVDQHDPDANCPCSTSFMVTHPRSGHSDFGR